MNHDLGFLWRLVGGVEFMTSVCQISSLFRLLWFLTNTVTQFGVRVNEKNCCVSETLVVPRVQLQV